ncbi:MAG: redoxin domain-containing protein, partial [Planctomycetes bacterium]|nr:redoxin domain-containing protein [Planctomycetota bacterium]
MRTLGILMCGLFIAVPMIVHSEPPPSTELKPGDMAPDFTLVGSDGVTYKLSEFRDRQVVVLAWYPKAFTPGCTAENTSFSRDGAAIRAHNAAYFTASCDTVEVNTRFGKSLKIDFPILSDPQGTTARAYGVVDDGRPVPR